MHHADVGPMFLFWSPHIAHVSHEVSGPEEMLLQVPAKYEGTPTAHSPAYTRTSRESERELGREGVRVRACVCVCVTYTQRERDTGRKTFEKKDDVWRHVIVFQ